MSAAGKLVGAQRAVQEALLEHGYLTPQHVEAVLALKKLKNS